MGGEIHPFLDGANAEQYYKEIKDSMHEDQILMNRNHFIQHLTQLS
jgi:hypothetical protein